MASDQASRGRVRYTVKLWLYERDNEKWWDVVDNIHPPKVIYSFRSEAEALDRCRDLNVKWAKRGN